MMNNMTMTPTLAPEPDIADVAALVGEPARARMMMALMGGQALTASELAVEADITAQTASSHLAKLVAGHLLSVRKQGRHRYFQISRPAVAELLESLLNLSVHAGPQRITPGPSDPQLREARICYDHLAGRWSVALYDALRSEELLMEAHGAAVLTEKGSAFFRARGADIDQLRRCRRPMCRSCLDWSERRHHLAGALGQWLLDDILSRGWARKDLDSRIVRFSASGLARFRNHYLLAG